ncbi:MAG: hypothetical protein WKF36_01220 [Candidatus Nitrosocosmicus sp.]
MILDNGSQQKDAAWIIFNNVIIRNYQRNEQAMSILLHMLMRLDGPLEQQKYTKKGFVFKSS